MIQKIRKLSFILLMASTSSYAQLGIGTNQPDISAALDISSSNQGFLPPRLDNIQKDKISSPAEGLMIFNKDEKCLQYWNGTTWLCAVGCPVPLNPKITKLSCSSASYLPTKIIENQPFEGYLSLPYSGGNAALYSSGSIINSTQVSGLSATLQSGVLAQGKGDFFFKITGTPNAAGIAKFPFKLFGKSCSISFTVEANKPPPLPANIVLHADKVHYIASVKDSNYLPYTGQNGIANTTTHDPDKIADTPTIDIQGVLSTQGVTLGIPYTVTSGSVNLPAFSVTVPSVKSVTENSAGGDVIFSYPATTLSGTGTLSMTIKAANQDINLKKLDINRGIGDGSEKLNGKSIFGVLFAEATIATDSAGGFGTIQVRDIAGIPDRNFGNGTHDFLYLPVADANGRIWLNHNLGAHYTDINHNAFNLAQEPTNISDRNAFGSHVQWGRYTDGHELINWSAPSHVNPILSSTASSITPNSNRYYYGSSANWYSGTNNTLWQGVNGKNNPCPIGFRLPSEAEINAMKTAEGITNAATAFSSNLKITAAGGVHYTNGAIVQYGQSPSAAGDIFWWSSSLSSSNPTGYARINNIEGSNFDFARRDGLTVRCTLD